MQKNWYAVYTKPNCEKKVSSALTKKGIENFCPLIEKKAQSILRNKISIEPLFKSYVFVRTFESEIISISRQINNVLSVLYWMGRPASINDTEMQAIREFTQNHKEINLEKLHVGINDVENENDEITYASDGKILIVRKRISKVHLPSLGYTMVGSNEEVENVIGKKISFGAEELLVRS
jgi:transcription antitermination factor NusG